jgi:hypothetical protein
MVNSIEISGEIMDRAIRAFRGWIIDSFEESVLASMRKNFDPILDQARSDEDFPMDDVRNNMIEGYRARLSLDEFRGSYRQSINIALDGGVSEKELYQMYLVVLPDIALRIDLPRDADLMSVDEQREIAWGFMKSWIQTSMQSDFKRMILGKAEYGFRLGRSGDYKNAEILKAITGAVKRSASLQQFNQTAMPRICKNGGINSDEAFELFHALLVYVIFEMGSKAA